MEIESIYAHYSVFRNVDKSECTLLNGVRINVPISCSSDWCQVQHNTPPTSLSLILKHHLRNVCVCELAGWLAGWLTDCRDVDFSQLKCSVVSVCSMRASIWIKSDNWTHILVFSTLFIALGSLSCIGHKSITHTGTCSQTKTQIFVRTWKKMQRIEWEML